MIARICPICGKTFIVYPCRPKRLCSIECASAWRALHIRGPKHWKWKPKAECRCHICGKIFHIKPSKVNSNSGHKGKYCSLECYHKWQKQHLFGANNSCWRDGKTPPEQRARSLSDYHAWRLAVLKRDRFRCQVCGKTAVDTNTVIETHHIKSFKEYPELRLDVTNGLAVCRTCHWNIRRKERRNDVVRKEVRQATCA